MQPPTLCDVLDRKQIFPSFFLRKEKPYIGSGLLAEFLLAEFLALAKRVELVAEAVTTPAWAANQMPIVKVVAASPTSPATQGNAPGA